MKKVKGVAVVEEGDVFSVQILGFGKSGDPFGRLRGDCGMIVFVRGCEKVMQGQVFRVCVVEVSNNFIVSEVVK
jgi:predicted RNA-binding protein with TRAM domain